MGKANGYDAGYGYVEIDGADGVTNGADQIVGTSGVDHIHAAGGDDIIKGGGGADYIDGGAGNDGASYEDSSVGVDVSLVTGKGHGGTAEGDTLVSIENLYGSKYDDHLTGNGADNLLRGGDGNDTIKGGGGADVLYGDAGNDVLEIDGAGDRVDGGEGIDTLVANSSQALKINLNSGFVDSNPWGQDGWHYGSEEYGWGGPTPHFPGDTPNVTGVENVIGSNYDDLIYGNDAANSLSGGNGNDLLSGLGGNDVISGGNGNDIIFGGVGADTLSGGQDADTFVWTAVNESLMAGGKPQDVVTDFQQGSDKIDLSAFNVGLNDLVELDNQTIDGANYAYVGIDANHNGQLDEGEFAIAVKMAAGTTLHNSDFLF
jgi:Ca2+-binding RTX toxin-like protein